MGIKQDQAGRCGWIALGFVFLLLQALLPGSFFNGMALFNTVTSVGEGGTAHLVHRMLILGGLIIGLLLFAALLMFLTMTINRTVSFLFRKSQNSFSSRITSAG